MKDVILEKSRWKQTRQSLYHASEAGNSGSVPSTYAAAYSQTSPYYNSSTSYGNYSGLSGFAKDINEIIEVSKSIRELIDRKDEDGVCYYSFHDEVSAARTVQGKLNTLMRYACQVERAIENQIDHKFYEEIDRVIYDLEHYRSRSIRPRTSSGIKEKKQLLTNMVSQWNTW